MENPSEATGIHAENLRDPLKLTASPTLQEALLRVLTDEQDLILTLLDASLTVRHASLPTRTLLGFEPDTWIGRRALDLIHPEEQPEAAQHFRRLIALDGARIRARVRVRHADESWRWLEVSAVNLLQDPAIGAIVCLLRDLAEQVQLEQAEQRLARGLRAVVRVGDELLQCEDAPTLYRRAVELAREHLGVERCALFVDAGEEMVGTFGTDDRGDTTDERGASLKVDDSWGPRHLASGDGPRWLVYPGRYAYIRDGKSHVLPHQGWRVITPIYSRERRIGAFCNDSALTHAPLDEITQEIVAVYCTLLGSLIEQKRYDDALRAGEARLRLITRATTDTVYHWELATNRHTWSASLEEVFGYPPEDVTENLQWWLDRVHPEEQEAINAALHEALQATGHSVTMEYRFRRADGQYAYVIDRGYIERDEEGRAERMIGALIDVSERRRLEEQLRQSQKMEAVGRLAGGVAHDFNNMLAVISGYSQLLLDGRPSSDPDYSALEDILRASERASALTRQLLAFSRRQVLRPQSLDLNKIVLGIQRMLRRIIGEDVELVTVLSEELGHIHADPGQLEQVIINLVINSRDAMPRGGQITLETENVHLSEEYARTHPHTRAGDFIMLAVTDTGEGMDAETQARAFEPFFTTKEQGKGTGLGLASVYGIVNQSGGHIQLYSEPGHGTCFRLYFPREDQPQPGQAATLATMPRGGTETVLLVEDERLVRDLISNVLQSYGYRVVEFPNAEQALRAADETIRGAHLLLTDVVMPRVSGRELAEAYQRVQPGLKVLFMSGYTDDAVVRHGILAAETNFLQKPFSPSHLAARVREILDGGSADRYADLGP